MTSKEALEKITNWIEYFTRLDYVEPEVRGEVQQKFYEAYHKTRPELELIEKDLEILDVFKSIIEIVENDKYTYVNKKYIIKLRNDVILNDALLGIIKEWLENEKNNK